MPVLEKIEKNKNAPLSLIFNGANLLGIELANLLIDQGAYVIIIDEYTQKNKQRMGKLIDNKLFSFIDISGVDSLTQSLDRLDYIFYLNHEWYDPDEDISTSEFLERSNTLDKVLEMGVDLNSKFLLTSSIKIHKNLQEKKDLASEIEFDESLNYTVLEVQRYAENLTWEYYKKGGLDSRIIRIGEVLGEEIDIDRKTKLVEYINQAIKGNELKVPGDGLENLFFVHVIDAAYGLIKAQFTEKTSGKVYSIVIPRDITVLNLAYKILDLEPRAGGINFVNEDKKSGIKIYKPAKNLKAIGWKPKISFERALAQTIDYFYKIYGKKRKKKSKPKVKKKEQSEIRSKSKKRRSIKDFIMNFFFEVKDVNEPKSVLDNVQYSGNTDGVLDNKGGSRSRVHLTTHKHNSDKPKRSKLKVLGWKIVDFFHKTKNKFRSLTVKKFILFSIFLIIILGVYLLFIVPLIRISYFSIIAYKNTKDARENISMYKYSEASNQLKKSYNALKKIDNNFKTLDYLEKIRWLNLILNYREKNQKVLAMTEGAKLLTESLTPIERYFEEYSSNIMLKKQENLDTIEEKSYELSEIENFENNINKAYQMLGDNEIFNENDFSIDYIGKYLKLYQESLNDINNSLGGYSDVSNVVSDILSIGKTQTYAILLVNENISTPKGGEIDSVCVFDIKNGSVTSISVYSSSEIEVNLSSEQERIIRNELKLLYPEGGLPFESTTLLFDDANFSMLVGLAVNDIYGSYPNHVITLNYKAASDLLSNFGSIEMENIGTVNSVNILEKSEDNDFNSKEFMAKLMNHLFNYHIEDMSTYKLLIENNTIGKDMVIYTEDECLKEYFYNTSSLEDISSCDQQKLYFKGDGEIPSIDVNHYINNEDSGLDINHKISLTANSSSYNGVMIIDIGEDSTINEVISVSPKVSLASSYRNRAFVNVDFEKGDNASVIINAVGDIEKESESLYNYCIYYERPAGFSYDYSIILNYGDNLEIKSTPSDGKKIDTTVKLEGKLEKDSLWNFEFTPRD